ncbi:hypothetical protein ACEXOS_014380 [Herbiconiux sp. P16]|uniref:hypothetical protein n=1 Tax=Herbiconiux wuyangfengii TaxID=3342794 RepID=UPI0035BB6D93
MSFLPERWKAKRLAIPALALTGLVLAGILTPPFAPAAHALPGRCGTPYVQWHNGTTYQTEDGTLVETGIKGSVVVDKCDVVEPPLPGDGGGSGTGGGVPGPPAAPPAPGPELPAPPPSMPAGAGPACPKGVNNSLKPAAIAGDGSGTGAIPFENVEEGLKTKNIRYAETTTADKLRYPGATRFTSLDINVGPSQTGAPNSNPYFGDSPEQAAQDLYWDDAAAPTWTEVAGKAKAVVSSLELALRFVTRASHGNGTVAGVTFKEIAVKLSLNDRETLNTMIKGMLRAGLSPAVNSILEDFIHDLAQILDMVTDPHPVDGVQLYLALASDGFAPDAGSEPNGGACGQVAAASAAASTSAGLTGDGEWVHVTLVGTPHGTLIDEIAAMTTPTWCPPVELSATAGQLSRATLTEGCTAPIASVRLLTRQDTVLVGAYSPQDLAVLGMKGSDPALDAGAWLAAFRDINGYYPDRTARLNSVSDLADGHTAIATLPDGKQVLEYTPPASAGGGVDGLVAAATDTSGKEHLFLVKVAVKSPPVCSEKLGTRFVGDDHSVVIQDGTLELVRGKSFTIDPKTFCETDWRDSYRVEIESGITGTTAAANPDGTLTFTWTDPNIVGANSTLKVTAWDEQTGAASNTVEIPVDVRDVAPICKDVHIEYDMAVSKGAPMSIPLDCAMTGGLTMLSPRIPQLVRGDGNGAHLSVASGELTASVDGLTFTPKAGAESGTVVVEAIAWNMNPWGAWNRYNQSSARFGVAVVLQ